MENAIRSLGNVAYPYSAETPESVFVFPLIYSPSPCMRPFSVPSMPATSERAEMRCWWRYDSCEFRDFLQTLPVYQEYIIAIAEALANDATFAQSVANACSTDSIDWIHAEAYRIGCARRAREIDERFRQDVHCTFSKQRALLDTDTQMLYEGTEGYTTARFTKRAQAAQSITAGGAHPTQQVYRMSSSADQLLREFQIGGFNVCYGNELQQVIHQECIDLIERTAKLESASPIFAYQATLVHCIDAAQTYNKVGQTNNATTVADFCYTLLDYGTAVVEGARDGL